MSFELHSPISGTLRHLNTLADPVFAEEIMGPGFAVSPGDERHLKVSAPTDGILTYFLMPVQLHARTDSRFLSTWVLTP